MTIEDARNMALLFFIDHLVQKSGRRTIHDLSCQFGARGFTDDMREAVGTTQEGLTEFLQSFPSLFTVDGDQVIYNGYDDMQAQNKLLSSGGRNRDYEKEAVQFFVNKLTKFGPELQIKSLLGHRSQAAPEVRLVSGRHLKDFCEFLSSQTEHFVVEGDRVRLKNMPEPSEDAIEMDDEGRPLQGVKAKQAAVEFLKSVLEQNEEQPIPLDAFYVRFCERFSHVIRQDVATNPKELLQFLKLNRQIFFIRSNKVSLVKNRPPEEGSEHGSDDGSAENVQQASGSSGHFPLDQSAISRIHLAKSLKPAQELVDSLLAEIMSNEKKVVGFDLKTVQAGDELFLTLAIVATTTQIGVFDLASSDVILLESGLRKIAESEQIVKVMHDARRVSTLLAHRYALHLRSVFDTQVAHAILQHDKFGKPLHETRPITFINLQRVYYPQSIMLSDVTPRKLSQSPNWGARPITEEQLLCVVEEAHCLVGALHQQLSNLIPVHLRGLFEDKCLEALLASPSRPPPIAAPGGLLASSYRPATAATATRGGRQLNAAAAPFIPAAKQKQTREIACQTFSTGDIRYTDIYYDTYHDK